MNKVANDVVVSSSGAFGGGVLGGGTPLPISYIQKITKISHVKAVLATVTATIPKDAIKTQNPLGSILIGVDKKQDLAYEGATTKIVEGRSFKNDKEIIVGKYLVQNTKLAGRKIKIGDKIKIPKKVKTTIQSLPFETIPSPLPTPTIIVTIVGIYQTGDIITDNNLYGSIKLARDISNTAKDKVNTIRVKIDDVKNVEWVANEIEKKFKNADPAIQTMISKNILSDINKTMDIFRTFLLIIALIAAIVGGVSIMIIMLMSILDRLVEFGILKATGWSNFNIIFNVYD